MLKKNKDYVEMRVSSTDCAFTQNAATTISIEGFSYDTSFRLPDPGESYVIVSKEKFEKLQESEVYYMALSTRAQYWKDKCERLQADNEHYREMAKQWEENHNLLLQKTGFDTVESLVFYLTNFGCDTLLEALASYVSERDKADENYNLLLKKTGFDTVEKLVNYLNSEAECDTLRNAIANLEYNVKFARDERRNLSKKLEECEKDYISERDKAEALQTENEQLKKKLHEFDPIPDYKELLAKLYSKDDVEKLEWTLNHICGGQVSVNGWMASAKFWKDQYEDLFKLVGFSSTEEIQDYLTNEAECDTLQEAVSKLKDQVKYTCEEWYSANSSNNSWKAAAECNSPKELIEKREALEKEIGICSRTLNEWKEGTGCPSPSAAKTLIERINCATPFDYTAAWQKATGFVTPEQAKSRIEGLENAVRLTNKNMLNELDSEIEEWQKATGCTTPEQAKERIKALNERINESEADYNHLLCTTGFESEGEIEDALDQCDHSTLRKALVDYEFDYEELLKLTGYKSNQDIRVALNYSEQFVYETLRELINSLRRNAKFTKSAWQNATGCNAPGEAETTMRNLKGRIDEIKEFAAIASNWTDRIVEG